MGLVMRAKQGKSISQACFAEKNKGLTTNKIAKQA